MRRRERKERAYVQLPEEDELEEPLLRNDSQGKRRYERFWEGGTPEQGSGSRAVVPHSINRVDWLALWSSICTSCQGGLRSIWSTIACCLESLLPQCFAPPPLSPAEAGPLEDLRSRIGQDYDPANSAHAAALQELWQLAFPTTPWGGPRNKQWGQMGWQRDDPATDFRGGGLLSLQNLLYLAREKPLLWRKLLWKEEGQRAEWEYPFAVAGVNLTYQLIEALDLRSFRVNDPSPASVPRTPAGRAFVSLLPFTHCLFEEVYCMAFQVLDREWLEAKASYMEFNLVMARTKAKVVEALCHRPISAAHLEKLLLNRSSLELYSSRSL